VCGGRVSIFPAEDLASIQLRQRMIMGDIYHPKMRIE